MQDSSQDGGRLGHKASSTAIRIATAKKKACVILQAVPLYDCDNSSTQAFFGSGAGSCCRERLHPVPDDFGGLTRRKIWECMAQFESNFKHICHAAFPQFTQEHQAS
jgi:hypothetical protein